MQELTLSIVKPDAVSQNIIGKIYTLIEQAGLKIVAAKMVHLSKAQAEQFYAMHSKRPFFADLVKFMISTPIMVQVLAGENAIKKYRELMGATNPDDAISGTIRAQYASSVRQNVVHGSDSKETASAEITFFFKPEEIYFDIS